jgi:exodeoxyribonuclease V alpha subunit
MLKRNLLYTAVTRAKRLFVMVGTKKAIAVSVRNYQVAERYSNLEKYLTHPSYNKPAI